MHKACHAANLPIVKILLDSGGWWFYANASAETAFHIASAKGRKDILELFRKKARIKEAEQFLVREVQSAVKEGSLPKLEALVGVRPDLASLPDASGEAPLHAAARYRQNRAAGVLLSHKVKVDPKNNSGESPLDIAVDDDNRELAGWLLSRGAKLSGRVDERGRTQLSDALEKERFDLAKLLISWSADVNSMDRYGQPLLVSTVFNGNEPISRLLLENHANVHARRTSDGMTPLHAAAYRKREELAEALVTFGADINSKDKHDETPLHYVSESGCSGIARTLLANGADVSVRDYKDRTPLRRAVLEGHKEIVDLLIAAGSDVLERSIYGYSLMRVALNLKKYEIWESLRSAWVAKREGHGTAVRKRLERELEKQLEIFAYGTRTVHGALVQAHDEFYRQLMCRPVDLEARGKFLDLCVELSDAAIADPPPAR